MTEVVLTGVGVTAVTWIGVGSVAAVASKLVGNGQESPSTRKEEKMKSRIGMLAVVAAMAITMAWSGTVLAGDKAPERGSWEFQAALETGTLPAGYFGTGKAAKDSAGKTSLVDSGGTVYRIGIDTP